jgi:hypothetical protein
MAAKGSIVLKIVIVLLVLVLWQVISIPAKIWSEEEMLENTSHNNMVTLYEAQVYRYNQVKSYVPSDSLENLLAFIKADSALNVRQKIGRLTHVLNDSINRILNVPTIKAMIPISRSLREINGDLEFNTRYFLRYDNIMAEKEAIVENMMAINGADFPNFSKVRNYIDSLSTLQERINERTLQNAAQSAQLYVDSILTYLPNMELDAVQSYWSGQYDQINNFIKEIKKTDIMKQSSVADRLKKFIDRVNTAMKTLAQINRQNDVTELQKYKSGITNVYNMFLQPENFLVSQNTGMLQLNEIDSLLVKFNEQTFYDPDDFDGVQRYIIAFDSASPSLTVESPNLLDMFQEKLQKVSQPLVQMPFLTYLDQFHTQLDSVNKLMDETKDKYRLARYSTDILLSIKELQAEMKDLNNVKFYRYVKNFKNFTDKVNNEKRLSVMKPLIEDILNPMDTLATRMKNQNINDLMERVNYFNSKLQTIDSLIANNRKIPSRTKRKIPSFAEAFQPVFGTLDQMKNSFNTSDADKMLAASKEIETALLETLNGYKEPVYYVFEKVHKNHGYIQNGQKSWEQE